MSYHFIKPDIVRSVEVPELLDSVSIYLHMSSALRLAQASGRAAALWLFKAREALGAVKVEVFVSDNAFKPKKVLHPCQLPCRVRDKTLPAHKVDLSQREVSQPVFKVQSIQSDSYCIPGHVHYAQALVSEGQLLETRQVWSFG